MTSNGSFWHQQESHSREDALRRGRGFRRLVRILGVKLFWDHWENSETPWKALKVLIRGRGEGAVLEDSGVFVGQSFSLL